MNIKSTEKPWGVEIKIELDNSSEIKTDVYKSECDGIIEDMIQVQRDLCSFNGVSDVDFMKRVIDTVGLNYDEQVELIEYLQSLNV